MFKGITLRKLEIFLSYMQNRNIAQTAEALDISKVSVHRTLHALEEDLRCALFIHQGRSLFPLDSASVLEEQSTLLLEQFERCIHLTRAASNDKISKLKIGMLYSLSIETVPKLIMGLKQRRPNLDVELLMASNQKLLGLLNTQMVDAILISTPESYDTARFETLPIFDDEIYLATPVDFPANTKTPIDLAQYRDQKFISLTEGFATFNGFQEAFKIAGFKPNIVMQVQDIFSLMSLVSSNMGCGLLPGRMRGLFSDKVKLLTLETRFQMKQHIALIFPRNSEHNLLPLIAECRMYARGYNKKSV
ncbi:LysR family transcriptional regulator [Chania multitudinisentens RB-25]|uniref:LysR family transcriptional regulator n=1 Tax=Chania multitudinisentens RB-25 TaxID=1441930 RepID=W0LKH6_9GAMM|nr:LysR family transcriptional regulator [Chania multitudinisentens]AHG22480.1 LysR family transcriptional regulator [Chania multitudinisentens RB-25]